MAHDLIAELAGYRAELANCVQRKSDRTDQVREQITRVEAEIRKRVEQLKAQADNHMTDGHDVLAAQALTEARRLARESGIAPAGAETETATESAPRETATPPKKKGA